MNRQTFAVTKSILRQQDAKRARMRDRSPCWPKPRTMADDLRDHPRPVNRELHVHFHSHGGSIHVHTHVHPSDHAHSRRTDTPAHEGTA